MANLNVQSRLAALAVVLASCAWGCSGGDGLPRQPISGKVTLDGQPLESALITFTPKGQGGDSTSAATQVSAGSFSIAREQGLVPGPYRVSISVMKEVPKKASKKKQVDNLTGEVVEDAGGEATEETLPARYNAQSELAADVTEAGPNEFTFPVTSK